MSTVTRKARAVGIVRVSQVGGREGESFASPLEQRDRIMAACERDGLRLVSDFGTDGIVDELDVSGGTPLASRSGLRQAVEAVENGEVDVIIAAYFDRLVRSLEVQSELVSRVERAGGQVLALDVGKVTNGSAGQWLSGTLLGAVSEYQRRTAKERSAEGQVRAIARGVVPWAGAIPGYLRGEDGRLIPDPDAAPTVRQAFELRADGATIADVRAFLAERGIERSYHGTQALLESRVVLGEIHFGSYEPNLEAHPPIVPVGLWQRVQRAKVSRGRRAKSERLLARLGVLRCATCGSAMIAATQTQNGRRYPFYRCGRVRQDCDRRAAISAEVVEQAVAEAVRAATRGARGRASAEQNARKAAAARDRAQADLDAALRAFAGLEGEAAARERLAELREARDQAQEQVDRTGGVSLPALRISTTGDWDRLSLDAQRALIRATVDQVTVAPGRGSDRISIKLVGQ